MQSTDDSPALDFSFGSFIFQQAFAKLGTALRIMFWGTLLQLAGVTALLFPLGVIVMPAVFAVLQPDKGVIALLMRGGILLLVIGGILVIVGEQRCLHLELPLGMTRSLPGHRWLRAAYWCHLGSWLLRLARNLVARGPLSLLAAPLQLLGFGLLLLFLRKIADVLARTDLRRLVDIIFALGGCTLLFVGLLVTDSALDFNLLKSLPASIAKAILLVPAAFFVLAVLSYVILLQQLSSAASSFSHFLATAQDPTDPVEELDENDYEPAG